jgi:hypothetical protein
VITNSTLNDGDASVVQLWYRPLGSEAPFKVQDFFNAATGRAVFSTALLGQVLFRRVLLCV